MALTFQALDQLDEAVGLEERLGYMEPPRLHQPVRQCLGWVLLQAGKVAEATDAFHKVRLLSVNQGGPCSDRPYTSLVLWSL